MNRIMIY